MIIGKIILLEAKAARDRTADLLSYGQENELSPNQLLRRGRATLFKTGAEAEAALLLTLQAATKNGDTWPAKFRFKIITVENNE